MFRGEFSSGLKRSNFPAIRMELLLKPIYIVSTNNDSLLYSPRLQCDDSLAFEVAPFAYPDQGQEQEIGLTSKAV